MAYLFNETVLNKITWQGYFYTYWLTSESCMSEYTFKETFHFLKVTRVIFGGLWNEILANSVSGVCLSAFVVYHPSFDPLTPILTLFMFFTVGWAQFYGEIAMFDSPKIAKSIQFIERRTSNIVMNISTCIIHSFSC